MDIFEFAIQMERDGQDFYQELAAKTNHKGLKSILTMLAEDEIKHQVAIEKVRITSCTMSETDVLNTAKNVFVQMRDFGDQVETDAQKELFQKLADEEKKHYALLRGLVDFAAAPKTWLADAEFEQLEEY